MTYLTNSFSLNMLNAEATGVDIERIGAEEVPLDVLSAVGHDNTAQFISAALGFAVPVNRITVKLGSGEMLYVAQYRGERLHEGATTLPKGSAIEFYRIRVR